MHKAALGYIKRGLAVFPVQPRGKEPVTGNGCKGATLDRDMVGNWWTTRPDLNIGIATGDKIFVVDVDDDRGGEVSLRKLENKHGPLPQTIEVITGCGRHLWFRVPSGRVIRNSVGKKSSGLGEGIDIRGEGGYVVVQPSIHPTGRKYEFSVDSAEVLANPPEWLIEATSWPPCKAKCKTLEEWHATLTNLIPEGTRNDTLASIAGKLLHSDVNLILVRDLLVCVNAARCEPPMSVEEVETITASVARTHLRNCHE